MPPIIQLVALILTGAVLLGMIAVLWSGVVSAFLGAPYVPIGRRYLDALLKFGELTAADTFYDLGSGDGRVLLEATKTFRVRRAVGYEAAWWPYWKSRWRVRQRGAIAVVRKNFFRADVGEATVVYLYLFPALVDRLAAKLAKELKSGSRVLCPSFPIDCQKHPEFLLKKEEKIGRMTAYLYERR